VARYRAGVNLPLRLLTLLLPSVLLAQGPADAASPSALAGPSASFAERLGYARLIQQSPQVDRLRVCLKFVEGSGIEWRAGRLQSRAGAPLAAVEALLAGLAIEPLFPALSWDELTLWQARAHASLPPHNRPGHLGLWYRITLSSPQQAEALIPALLQQELVEWVHHEPLPTPASHGAPANDIPPATPLFTNLQTAHELPPTGYGIWQAQTVFGARGRGTSLRMVENDWYLDHEDVRQLVLANFLGAWPGALSAQQAGHGTAGTSILCADRNRYGMTGIVDEAQVRFVPQITNGGVANALLVAAADSQPGDVVMLVFMFLLGQQSITDWVPIEFLQSIYDASLTITANGRLLVNSAANGGSSLDDPRFLRRFDRSFRDSGAIMVGASAGSQLQRAVFSNYGSRVDTNGHGLNVVACGIGTMFYPNGDNRQSYTADYQGTSSATPAVAGVVLALQGAARAQLGRSLSRTEILSLLQTHGTASPDAIGRRPDLPAMLATLGALDGLLASAPDVPLGNSVTLELRGSPGSAGFLFFSFAPGNTPFGLNRPLLLDFATVQTLGLVLLPIGVGQWPLAVPNVAVLGGVNLYFQAGLIQGSAPLHVTNSAQVTVL
jgi:hypothetical protein